MRLPANQAWPLTALLLAGATGQAQAKPPLATIAAPTGPAADYPVIVGAPFVIGTTTWTPADQLNYDAVGLAGTANDLSGIAAAHKTLPLPSYAEITALDTGRTILVRVVARGPQDNETLVALSPAAATQLGLPPGARAAVRVRRVNPPEVERAALRTGESAPMRMETPESLLKVLRRKLADQSPLMPPPSVPPAMPMKLDGEHTTPAPVQAPSPDTVPAKPFAKSGPKLPIAAKPRPSSVPRAAAVLPATEAVASHRANGTHVVQVAAFSTRERAAKAAHDLGGVMTSAGRFWRVRLGPFNGAKDAASALEKARSAGYRDARIQRAD
jgi:rare lipoprotein A